MKEPIIARAKSPFSNLFARYSGDTFARQQLTVLLYSALIVVFTVPLNLFGIAGPSNSVFETVNAVWIVVMLFLIVLFYMRKLTLRSTLTIHFIIAQTCFCIAMLYTGMQPTATSEPEIVADIMLSTAVVSLSMAGFLRSVPYILTVMALTAYTVAAFMLGSESLKSFLPIFAIVLFIECVLGEKLLVRSRSIEEEHNVLKTEETSILNMLGLEKHQAVALAKFTESELTENSATDFNKILGKAARQKLIAGVAEHIRKERMDDDCLAEVFPELSVSERNICRLILQGRKQGDICAILQTTKGNVTSQRSHIRTKLGVQSKENLKEFLIKKMSEHSIEV